MSSLREAIQSKLSELDSRADDIYAQWQFNLALLPEGDPDYEKYNEVNEQCIKVAKVSIQMIQDVLDSVEADN